MVRVKFHVARNEQVQQAIAVVIAPRRSCGPSSQCHTGFLRHVRKRSIMIVVVEAVFSKIRDIDVRPAIIIVIAYSYAEAPPLVRYTCFVRNVSESAVVIVVKQHGARSGFLPLQRGKRGTVEQIDVQPPVVVKVDQGHAGTWSLENSRLVRPPRTVAKFAEPGLSRDVHEHHGCAVNESPGGDRPG